MQEWFYPVGVVLLGYTVLGLTGFGSSLVVVPLLAWTWPLPDVVALALLMDVPASAFHSGLNWRQVQWRELRRLLPGMVLGTLLGLWLVQHMNSRWPLLVLGVYVAGVGINALRPKVSPASDAAPVWAWPAGAAIGLVEMIFGTAGPLVVAWLSRRLSDVQQLRATTPLVIAVAAATVLIGMAWEGRLSSGWIWQRWVGLIGVALAGVWLGHRLAHRVPVARLRQIICGLLVVSGVMLALGALR
ncbi:sulfite exporter TauE/SafE family protein [Limnohabitans sp. 2KL-27]|uniref:sulfite exporter TauE/SafE family protein n=1 Tax=Limnohabitans sp. 2KL-27 TaxID=1100705 RepID=UPI000A861983|nr:sulfite exporter TauE/SafE family protein [Limnohabitans sp. 2KL-27]